MNKTPQAELKACPFCPDGGQPFIQIIGNEHTKDRGADVGCTGCGFTKHIRVVRFTCEWAEERAIEAWNTRAIPAPMGVPDKLPHPLFEIISDIISDASFSNGKGGYDIDIDQATQKITEILKPHLRTPDARIVEAKGIIRDLLGLAAMPEHMTRYELTVRDRALKWLKEMGE